MSEQSACASDPATIIATLQELLVHAERCNDTLCVDLFKATISALELSQPSIKVISKTSGHTDISAWPKAAGRPH